MGLLRYPLSADGIQTKNTAQKILKRAWIFSEERWDYYVIPTVRHGRPVQTKDGRKSSSELGYFLPSFVCGKIGIRTLETVTRLPHFECGAIDHSAIFPKNKA